MSNNTASLPVPKPVQPVKILDFDPDRRLIRFQAVGWVAGLVVSRRMGNLRSYPSGHCVLTVNNLYEFEQVYDWLQSLEAPQAA